MRQYEGNALITDTTLGREGHGIFTFYLYLDYGGSGQAAGGFCLDTYDKEQDKRVGWKSGIELIMEIIDVIGADNWEDIKGRHIRVKYTDREVLAIGHFIEDKWLNFKEFIERR